MNAGPFAKRPVGEWMDVVVPVCVCVCVCVLCVRVFDFSDNQLKRQTDHAL